MRNTDDFKERFRRWKENGENYWAIRADRDQYDYNRAVELGYGPDGTGHWPSRDNLTGRILKSGIHPTIIKSAAADAVEGYRWNVDKNGNIYSNTWDELEKQRTPVIEPPYLPQYSGGKPKRQYYPVYDAAKYFALDGVKAVMSSGLRKNATVAGTNRRSLHAILGGAADYVGDFENMLRVINDPNSNTYKWMKENRLKVLNEAVKHGGTMKYWPEHRKKEFLAGGRTNDHLHIYQDLKEAIDKDLELPTKQNRNKSTLHFEPDFNIRPEAAIAQSHVMPTASNEPIGPIQLPNIDVTGDIRAAIQKMDEEKRNRALDEITRFGPLPNPIAFFNSFWGEDLPTKQTLNKPVWTVL